MSIENLLVNRRLLKKQLFWLQHSFEEVQKIGLKDSYAVNEFDSYENLCSRFGRMIDFLVRKMFRSIDDVEFENQGTLIDTVNNAHKRALFEDMDTMRSIKDLRNTISHEYLDDGLEQLFGDVAGLTPSLIKMTETTLDYTKQFERKNQAGCPLDFYIKKE